MKQLYTLDGILEADYIVKTNTDIIGYNIGSSIPVWSFKGISDFTQFQLAEGQDWDVSEEEQQEATIAGMAYELIQKDLAIQTIEATQADVIYQLMVKGVL